MSTTDELLKDVRTKLDRHLEGDVATRESLARMEVTVDNLKEGLSRVERSITDVKNGINGVPERVAVVEQQVVATMDAINNLQIGEREETKARFGRWFQIAIIVCSLVGTSLIAMCQWQTKRMIEAAHPTKTAAAPTTTP